MTQPSKAAKESGAMTQRGRGTKRVHVLAPFYCVQMVSEDSGLLAKFALMGERLDFIGWVSDGRWDYQPDELCEDDVRPIELLARTRKG